MAQCCASAINKAVQHSLIHMYGSMLCIMHQYGSISLNNFASFSIAHHASKLWLNLVHQESHMTQCCASGFSYSSCCASGINVTVNHASIQLNVVHPWLNDVHQASVWLKAVYQVSIWLNMAQCCASGIVMVQYGLLLCRHQFMA